MSDELLSRAREDANVVGVVHSGSRGRGSFGAPVRRPAARQDGRGRGGAERSEWLEWELREHPLPVEVDLERLRRIATTGGIAAQQSLFREAEQLARDAGLSAVIDGWEPDLEWLRGE